jgi:hypothetical protein
MGQVTLKLSGKRQCLYRLPSLSNCVRLGFGSGRTPLLGITRDRSVIV